MKRFLFLFLLTLSTSAFAYTSDFRPYIGIDTGLNIADYLYKIDLDDTYYSATINAGARIGKNFGAELFITHSSTNNIESVYNLDTINHEIYYIAFGFDIFAYYNLSKNADFFTTFGVANYRFYDKHEYITSTDETETIDYENNVTSRFGIGFIYTFPTDHVSGILQYHYTPINNELFDTMSEFSIGVRYTF